MELVSPDPFSVRVISFRKIGCQYQMHRGWVIVQRTREVHYIMFFLNEIEHFKGIKKKIRPPKFIYFVCMKFIMSVVKKEMVENTYIAVKCLIFMDEESL